MNIHPSNSSNHDDSVMDSSTTVDEYSEDPNINVSDVIEKYDVPNDKHKEKKNLTCVVCGGRAFGYNFDQISCESCKAFFRRNALRNVNELQCRFSGNCTITVETRRHCSYCRIRKCFAVGMKKESIRSEEEKILKRIQTENIRQRRSHENAHKIPALMTVRNSNILLILNALDRTRLNNITHCYEQYTGEPSIKAYSPPPHIVILRLDEFFNRKKPIFINLISYFKQLPELKALNVDDQVTLIKQNIRLLMPLNYALLKTPVASKFRDTRIETVGCTDNANLHTMYQALSNSFVDFVTYDPIIIKLFLIISFFTTTCLSTRSIYDAANYKELKNIKQIQSSYIELLWLYMIEKCGEQNAIHLFTKMISKYMHVQIIMDRIDSIVQANNNINNIDTLVQSFLQLT